MKLARISPILFVGGAFALATILEPRWSNFQRQQSKSVLEMALGDGRKLFANHFFTKADVYFHRGYYPSIFDQLPKQPTSHLNETPEEHAKHAHESAEEHAKHANETPEEHAAHAHEDHADHEKEHAKEMDFLGESRDYIEAFGRHFFASEHSHMGNADARELLPWFKIAAELDPQREETYVTASFWLRNLGKFDEAEQFLRQGWRENPNSSAILLELGRVYDTNRREYDRARNVWELALAKWEQQEKPKSDPDLSARQQIVAHLAALEEKTGRFARSLYYLEQLVPLSPHPEEIKKQITEMKVKLGK